MRLHLLHIAKFATLVALAVIITHTLGDHAQGSFRPARHIAGVDELRIQTNAGLNPGRTVLILRADVHGNRWHRQRELSRPNESLPAVAQSSVAAPATATAEPDASTISSIWVDLKATVTLLRAYGSWIRASSQSISDPVG